MLQMKGKGRFLRLTRLYQKPKFSLSGQVGILFFVSLIIILGVPHIWAAPPTPQECDQSDSGERLKCKFDNVVDQQEHMVNLIDSSPLSDVLTDQQREGLNKAKDRAVNSKNKLQSDDFKQLTKKRDVDCETKEYSGDGDGICESGEECEEVIGDQIGDDIQPCKPKKGKNKEVCVEICDEEAVSLNEDNFDPELAADLEEIYDDMTNQTQEVNEILEEEAMFIPSVKSLLYVSDPCELATGGLVRTPFTTYVVLSTLAVTTRGLADIAERGCDQSVLGTNGATVCIAVETVASLAAVAWNAVDEIEATIDSLTIDATLSCLEDVKAEVKATQGQISEVQGQISEMKDQMSQMKAELIELFDQVIELLNTPQGQRPDFPK